MESKVGYFVQSFPALLHWERKSKWWSSWTPGQFFDTYEEALKEIEDNSIQGAKIVKVYNPR